jgi:predicted oxidoreductase
MRFGFAVKSKERKFNLRGAYNKTIDAMKQTLFFGCLLLCITLNAQTIEKDYKDDFSGKRVVYTDWERINWGITHAGKQFQTKFGLENDNTCLRINWICGERLTVEEGALLLVKLDNGDIFQLEHEILARATPGGATTNMLHGSIHDYGVSLVFGGDVSGFGAGLVTKMRIATTGGYVDFEVSSKNAKKLFNQYQLFDQTIRN